jgi:hypothetical protein
MSSAVKKGLAIITGLVLLLLGLMLVGVGVVMSIYSRQRTILTRVGLDDDYAIVLDKFLAGFTVLGGTLFLAAACLIFIAYSEEEEKSEKKRDVKLQLQQTTGDRSRGKVPPGAREAELRARLWEMANEKPREIIYEKLPTDE